MDPAALWTCADKRRQCELGSAPLTGCVQAATGNQLGFELAAVGIRDEFDQFSSFGKGATPVAAI
jgi:hypothetical protein